MRLKHLQFPLAVDTVAQMTKEDLDLVIDGQKNIVDFLPRISIAAFFLLVIEFVTAIMWNTPVFQRVLFDRGPLIEEISVFTKVINVVIVLVLPLVCIFHIVSSLRMRAKVKKAPCYAANIQLVQNRLDEIAKEENEEKQKQAECYTNAVKEVNAILQRCGCHSPSLKLKLSDYLRTH
ncbi:hypothetical protein KBC03_04390 [Patescibacteria group bacterium]|nr:hypothetical protein [Patescibacteria group bacterium]